MGVGHGLAHLVDQAQDARAVPLGIALAQAPEDDAQVVPLHELHREVDAAVVVEPEIVHGDDAGVVQLAGDLRLLQEAPQRLGVDRLLGRGRIGAHQHDLHRQATAQVLVPDPHHGALAAAIHLVLDAVAAAPEAQLRQVLGDLGVEARHLAPGEGDVGIHLGPVAAPDALRHRVVRGGLEPAGRREELAQLVGDLGGLAADRLDVHLLASAHRGHAGEEGLARLGRELLPGFVRHGLRGTSPLPQREILHRPPTDRVR